MGLMIASCLVMGQGIVTSPGSVATPLCASTNGIQFCTATTNMDFWAGANISLYGTNRNGHADVTIAATGSGATNVAGLSDAGTAAYSNATAFALSGAVVPYANLPGGLGLLSTNNAANLTNVQAGALPAFSGDITTTAGSAATTLKNTGTAGTYTKTTFDAQGRETGGASASLASGDFANQGTATTVLHGNAAGNPNWSTVNLATDVTGTIGSGSLPTTGSNPYWFKPWYRRLSVMEMRGSGSESWFGDGGATALTGTGGIVAAAPSATLGASFLQYSGGTAASYYSTAGDLTYRTGRNILMTFRTALTNTSNLRFWFALTDQTAATMMVADNPAGNYAGFLATTNITSGFTNNAWVTVSKDGTTQTTTVTSSALDTNPHLFSITFNDGTPNVVFAIDGSTVASHTTHLPSAATVLRYVHGIYGTTATSAGDYYDIIAIESDK